MNNIQGIIYIVIAVVFALLLSSLYMVKTQLNTCKENNAKLQSSIETQNKLIEQNKNNRVDSTDTTIKEVIKNKYIEVKIPVKDEICEVKLKAINEISNLYFYNSK